MLGAVYVSPPGSFCLVFEHGISHPAHATIRKQRERQEGDPAKMRILPERRLLTLPATPPAFRANSTTAATHMTFD